MFVTKFLPVDFEGTLYNSVPSTAESQPETCLTAI